MKTTWAILIGLLLLPGAALAGSEHAFGRSAGNCGGRWPLPDTGLAVHYSTAPGDDSDYRPAAIQPRYTILNPVGVSSVTVDGITGLVWVTNPVDAGIVGPYNWEPAMNACEGLSYAGYADWRLPNMRELESIVDYSAYLPAINVSYFLNTKSQQYWSSTTKMSAASTTAWQITFNDGRVTTGAKTTQYYIRCVRGGQ